MHSFLLILRDQYWVGAFEATILLLVLVAIWMDSVYPSWKRRRLRKNGGVTFTASVVRGEQSRRTFHLGYGFATVIATQIVSSSEDLKGYKTSLTVLNLLALMYLAYFNYWAQNKLLGWLNRWEKRSG